MKHLHVVYFFSTLLVGVLSLGIAAFVYRKSKDRTIRDYLYFYLPFTLVVVFYTALTYIEANVHSVTDPKPLCLSILPSGKLLWERL